MQQRHDDESLSYEASFCPSFNSYASDGNNNRLVTIAARVSKEFQEDEKLELESNNNIIEEEEEEEEDDGFEFVSAVADLDFSNRLFLDGEIRQVFPVFNRNLLLNEEEDGRHVEALKKLFTDYDDDDDDDDDQGRRASSSSSDEEEPDGEPSVTFCIWLSSPKRSPNPPIESSQSPTRCKKSNSTGSSPSKKWFKFRDLLKRSNSDGKHSFVYLDKPKSKGNGNRNGGVDSKEKNVKSPKAKKATAAVSAHEAFYVKNRAMKEGDKKRCYLPYRPDLLGVFANYKGLGKTLPPSF